MTQDSTTDITRTRFRRGKGPKPDDFGDHFYIAEIVTQCWFAEASFQEMRALFAKAPTSIGLQAMAHSILVFAGNVAKILSASRKGTEEQKRRALRLQRLLKCEEHDFSAVINARNYLEHFDERIERHLHGDHDGILLHRIVSDSTSEFFTLDGGDKLKAKYLQHLNTSTLELTMAGETIQLGLVVEQVVAIKAKAEALDSAV